MKTNNLKKKLKRSIIAIFFYWLIISSILYFAADFIIFKPSKTGLKFLENSEFSQFTEIKEIYKDNKKTLKAFFLPKKSNKILVYFHGNVGDNSFIIADKFFKKTNLNLLIPTYYGYKPSTGKASEKNFYLSADKVMEYLLNNGWKEENIVIMGTSLGAAAAIYLASKYTNLDRTIVVNGFDSINSMCLKQYYIFCIFAKNIINSTKYAQNIDGKIFQFHSIDDKIVPYQLGKKLFSKIRSDDKKFFDLNGNHNDFSLDKIIKKSQL
tara:strand:- start:1546 stop:2346 length:801 start_codon:yes stop_codon:yes gene_type:complete